MNKQILTQPSTFVFDDNLADVVNKIYDSKPDDYSEKSKEELFTFNGGLLNYSLILEPYNPFTIFTKKFMKLFAYCQEKEVCLTSLAHLFTVIETVKERLEKNPKIDEYDNFLFHLRKNLEVGIITGSFLTYGRCSEMSGTSLARIIPIISIEHYGDFFPKAKYRSSTIYSSGDLVENGYLRTTFEELVATKPGMINTLTIRTNYEKKFKGVFDYLTGGKQIVFELGDQKAKQLGDISMPFFLKTTQDELIISANQINPEGFVRVMKWKEKTAEVKNES